MKTIYARIASALEARQNCEKSGNDEWFDRHTETIERITKQHMPSGSGIDAGMKFDFDKSTSNKLIWSFGFHHMNDGGYYDGWTEHNLIVTPSLAFGIDVRITGRNRNQIKDYLHETMHYAVTREVEL